MPEKAHNTDHEPQTVTHADAPLGAAIGWAEYSPTRQQWRSLTRDGALAYHATADDAERHLTNLLPPRNRPSPRPFTGNRPSPRP
jgi:hypothetical protein